jgi:protein farnesyltransferase/geranylgeranyltransferase type-1 subunit alpha
MTYTDYDWTDLVPIPQDDGDDALVKIHYAEDYNQANLLLRAVISAAGFAGVNSIEQTERVVALTRTLVELNPGHVTAWHCRLVALRRAGAKAIPKENWLLSGRFFDKTMNSVGEEAGTIVIEDYTWLDAITQRTAKNFQIWHYRQCLAPTSSTEFFSELAIAYHTRERAAIKEALAADAKNYHAWAHFSWLLSAATPEDLSAKFPVTDNLNYIQELLEKDVLNNSAWAFRYFLIASCGGIQEVLVTEFDFVATVLPRAPQNESVWNYVEGLAKLNVLTQEQLRGLAETYCTKSTHARELLAELDLFEQRYPQAQDNMAVLEELVPVRMGYWKYKFSLFQ